MDWHAAPIFAVDSDAESVASTEIDSGEDDLPQRSVAATPTAQGPQQQLQHSQSHQESKNEAEQQKERPVVQQSEETGMVHAIQPNSNCPQHQMQVSEQQRQLFEYQHHHHEYREQPWLQQQMRSEPQQRHYQEQQCKKQDQTWQQENKGAEGQGGEIEDRSQAARAFAASLRAKEPLLQGQQKTSRDNPDFVHTFFRASRLHFIGVWRERYEEILDSLPPPPPLPPQSPNGRVIVHLDMDCFFASVATLGRNDLFHGLPVVVAWGSGGCSEISSANYEARAAGVRAGMWMREASQLCPELVVMPYEFARIMETAEKFYRTVLEITPFVQGVSCDEVYADVTHLCEKGFAFSQNGGYSGTTKDDTVLWTPASIARHLRDEICRHTGGCTASVGVGKNRLLARLATKSAKPRPGCEGCRATFGRCTAHPGFFVLEESAAREHLESLPVRDLPGVGPETEKHLLRLGVCSVSELRDLPQATLQEAFGSKQAHTLHSLAYGVDERPWEPRPRRKSVGAQISWGVRFDVVEKAHDFCKQLTEEALRRLGRHGSVGSSLTLKVWKAKPGSGDAGGVGCGHCDVITRSSSIKLDPQCPGSITAATSEAVRLFDAVGASPCEVRGLGIHIGGLNKTKTGSAIREETSEKLLPVQAASCDVRHMLSSTSLLKSNGRPLRNEAACKGEDARVVLHLDVNCFFLAVHERYDPSLKDAGPLVLWQYNDVICISPEAKEAGVQKHMRPSEAQPIVEKIGGRMVHAFARRWPGPRVWYGPYQSVSREMFAFLNQRLRERLQGNFVLERVSIDEAYLDVSTAMLGSLEAGEELARSLVRDLKEEMDVCVSVGIARSRLLSKLGSVAAKPPKGNGLLLVRDTEALLQSTPVTRLPGCGGRGEQLQALGIRWATDLQRLGQSGEELRAALGGDLSLEVAGRLVEACRGRDGGTQVRAAEPKKSLVVTSWLTDACLSDLALKEESLGNQLPGTKVIVGNGWVFDPQVEKGVTNQTRGRWLLLALVLDLEAGGVSQAQVALTDAAAAARCPFPWLPLGAWGLKMARRMCSSTSELHHPLWKAAEWRRVHLRPTATRSMAQTSSRFQALLPCCVMVLRSSGSLGVEAAWLP
eukprot:TRINITY_DN32992_c0_g1_i1.p1 TRINITY_DN32992_c0_g1~~TRINITY_DN32992_c0_g1_i1.p1  ORF type:complete len:1112 (+),score=185.85 TRINITY_DN32992_c0_g1_i1:113-3448(+)